VAAAFSVSDTKFTNSGYNTDLKTFIQSYENSTILDSSILIAPLVFFIAPCDPRFIRTVDKILLPPEKGGLTSTGLVFRYNTDQSDDGLFPSTSFSFLPKNCDTKHNH